MPSFSILRPSRIALSLALALGAALALPAQAAVASAADCSVAGVACSASYRFENASLVAGQAGNLPDLEIVESSAGAFDLSGNRTIALFPAAPLVLDKTAAPRVEVRNARGELVANAVSARFLNGILDSRGELRLYLDAGWNSPGDGPYRIKLSGLRATVVDSSYDGDAWLHIGGSRRNDSLPLEDADLGSGYGAKATLARLAVKVSAGEGSALPSPVRIADPRQAVIAGLEFKLGSIEGQPAALYVAAMLGGQILILSETGWAPFDALAAAAAAGQAPKVAFRSYAAVPKRVEIDLLPEPTDLSGLNGLSVLVGYGVGANPHSFAGPGSAFADMLNNNRYTEIYRR